MEELDFRNMNCPLPVVNTKKYFDGIAKGEATILLDNETAFNNVSRFASSNNLKIDYKFENKVYYLHITKSESEAKDDSASIDKCTVNGLFTIVIGSDKLGSGEEKLGNILMKSYMFALSESSKIPTDMLFLNSGVKLTIKDSDVIESIKSLEKKGVRIKVCGTCLDYYKIIDKVDVGEVSNMYSIVETMNSSDKIINL